MPASNFWDARFEGEAYRYGTEPNAFLRAEAGAFPAGGRVLSIGEGEGRNAAHLAGLGLDVTALDGSSVGLAKARRLAEARGLHIHALQADLNDYRFAPAQWDGVMNFFCHLPPALRRRVNQGIVQALRPGGVLILEGFTPEQLQFDSGGPRDPAMLWQADTLREELDGLDFAILREVRRPLAEGSGHAGMGAVVQLLARKP